MPNGIQNLTDPGPTGPLVDHLTDRYRDLRLAVWAYIFDHEVVGLTPLKQAEHIAKLKKLISYE